MSPSTVFFINEAAYLCIFSAALLQTVNQMDIKIFFLISSISYNTILNCSFANKSVKIIKKKKSLFFKRQK